MSVKEIIDIGINLCSGKYKGDHMKVLNNAYMAYISALISISNSRVEWDQNIKLIKQFKDHKVKLYCTIGVHPHNAKSICNANDDQLLTNDKLNAFKALLLSYHDQCNQEIKNNNNNNVAVGECGLDYNRMFSPKQVQIDVFKVHIEVAASTGKPLYIHERDAGTDMVQILTEAKQKYPNLTGVIHCFTGKRSIMLEYVRLGFYIGITGWICDDRRNSELLNAVQVLPLDRLCIETDGPFLTPPAYAKKFGTTRNESDSLSYIIDRLAKVMNVSVEEIRQTSYNNTKLLFKI